MARDFISVDRVTFERLVRAAVAGDQVAAMAAIDEMSLVHHGGSAVSVCISLARKDARGIIDAPRPVADPFPVPGHLRGSTIGDPWLKIEDKVGGPAKLASLRA